MSGDKAILRSTIAAVGVVAIVAGFVSYRHALQVVSAHGETGWLAKAYPLTIDGLIYASSMVLLNAARRGLDRPRLAYWALSLGITATLGANIAAGLHYGLVGALVAAWPAPALVISYELLMLVIRSSATAPAQLKGNAPASEIATPRTRTRSAPVRRTPAAPVSETDAASEFMDELARGDRGSGRVRRCGQAARRRPQLAAPGRWPVVCSS